MRLWHFRLIKSLPRQQLLSQWRECICIAKNLKENGTPNHILVNKILDFPRKDFNIYCNYVLEEMNERGYKVSVSSIGKLEGYIDFEVDVHPKMENCFDGWHNIRYLRQCMSNLQEKMDGRRVVQWECECSCGSDKKIIASTHDIKSGHTSSCGCAHKEISINSNKRHGETSSRLYYLWCGMKSRCYNINNPKYKDYGGRGIKVCEEWKKSYEEYRDWALDNGYQDNLTIDRIDVNGDYCPKNCRWVDLFIQANNKRNNFVIDYNGETHTVHEWSALTGISHANIRNRLKILGWSVEDALFTPLFNHVK